LEFLDHALPAHAIQAAEDLVGEVYDGALGLADP
jgi:hypothetical protein